MIAKKCPQCHSEDVDVVEYNGAHVVSCNECSFTEEGFLDDFPEERTSQKAKKQHSPYKAGGGKRTVKLK